MLMTVAKFMARPETKRELLKAIRTLVQHSRAEAGCLEYGCYEDILGENILFITGRWIEHHALEQHYEGVYFREFIARCAELAADILPSVSLYEVIEIDRL